MPKILEILDDQHRGLCLMFNRRQDRYYHQIAAVDGTEVVPLITSVEGTNEDWPSSPPLQELTVEQRAAGPVALLVGRAGTSHWSMSVELNCPNQQIDFDVACRTASDPRQLGSLYTGEAALVRADENGAVIGGLAQLAIARDSALSDAKIELTASRLELRVAASSDKQPATFRWKYSISRM